MGLLQKHLCAARQVPRHRSWGDLLGKPGTSVRRHQMRLLGFSQVTHRPQRPHWGVLGKAQDEAKFMRASAWQWVSGRYIGFLPPNCQCLPAKEHQNPPGVGQVRATAHCSPGNAHHGEAQGVSGTGYQERFIRGFGPGWVTWGRAEGSRALLWIGCCQEARIIQQVGALFDTFDPLGGQTRVRPKW